MKTDFKAALDALYKAELYNRVIMDDKTIETIRHALRLADLVKNPNQEMIKAGVIVLLGGNAGLSLVSDTTDCFKAMIDKAAEIAGGEG